MSQPPHSTPAQPRLPRNPPRAESVGSLLRPPALKSLFERAYSRHVSHVARFLDAEERTLATQLETIADTAIRDAVNRQINAGLDVVTDGEMRRAHFANSLFDALGGIAENPAHYEYFAGDDPVAPPPEPLALERMWLVENPLIKEITFLESVTDYPYKVTILAPSAALYASVEFNEDVYPTRDAFVAHTVELLREIALGAVDAGARYVQFDFPLYPGLVDPDKSDDLLQAAGKDQDSLLSDALAADRAVVQGLPADVTVALHICRGNFRSQWWSKGSLEPVAERMFNELPFHRFLIEWEDTDREGDYRPLRFVPRNGPTVVMGVVSSKVPDLEREDEIMRRMDAAATYLDYDQLALSPQCGFASVWYGNKVSEEVQWAKLELIGRVAERIWGGA